MVVRYMVKYILIGGMLVLCSCAKIEFEDAMGNRASYSRFGRTDLKYVKYNNGDVVLEVGSAQGDSGKLGEALANTSEAVLNMSKVVAPVP